MNDNKGLIYSLKLGILGMAFALLIGYTASTALAQSTGPISNAPMNFSGTGGQTIGPLDLAEGSLFFDIEESTDCQSCGFFVSVRQDNNLDGEYCASEDGFCGSVYSGGYEDIKNLNVKNKEFASFFYGGNVEISVDAPNNAPWKITLRQNPYPRHAIGGTVLPRKDGMKVSAVSSTGQKYEAITGYLGEYKMTVYGYRAYTVTVQANGYKTATKTLKADEFLALNYPTWNAPVDFDLKKGEDEVKDKAVIYCTVKDKESNQPLAGVRVTIDGKSVTTKDNGTCAFSNLQEKEYTIQVAKTGYASQAKKATAVTTRSIAPVVFLLEKTATEIKGTVKDSWSGAGVKGLNVYLTDRRENPIGDMKTNDNGQYSFKNIKPGKYVINAGDLAEQRYSFADAKLVELASNEVKVVDFEVEPLSLDITAGFDGLSNSDDIIPEQTLDYNITVSNNGPEAGKEVKLIVDTSGLADKAQYVSATPSVGDCKLAGRNGILSDVVCELGNMEKNDSAVVSIKVRTKAPGDISMSAVAYDTSRADWKKVEWKTDNNESTIKTIIKSTKIEGKIVAFVQPSGLAFANMIAPLPNVKVVVELNGSSPVTIYTDEDGNYNYDLPITGDYSSYRLTVSLEDKDGIISVDSEKGFSGYVVELKTKELPISGSTNVENIVFAGIYRNIDAQTSAEEKSVLIHAGTYYANTYKALKFAQDKLKLKLDYSLPVDVYLFSDDKGVFYTKEGSYISVNKNSSSSIKNDSPDNREYHEFGHHVHADSKMGGENTYPSRKAGEKNHGGVDNKRSMDSILEGFAEFFSLLVKGNPQYRWAGNVTNLEKNYHRYTDNLGDTKPDEEFLVASLLWDFYDNNVDATSGVGYAKFKDNINMSVADIWAAIDKPSVKDVRSLYEALKVKVGTQDKNKTDGVTDLDALFISHYFFSDTNDNSIWDTGEPIGYADAYATHDDTNHVIRRNKEGISGTLLSYSMVDEQGEKLNSSVWKVVVHYGGNEEEDSFTTASNDFQQVRFMVPWGADYAEVKPVLAGYSTEAYRLTPDEYWPMVEAAPDSPEATFGSHEFKLTSNGIEAPTNLKVSVVDDTTTGLSWSYEGDVLLVRGLNKYPTSRYDGEVIYEGTDKNFTDSNQLTGLTYYYSLFAVSNDQISKPVQASLVSGEAASVNNEVAVGGQTARKVGEIAGFIIVILLVVGLFIRLKKRAK